MENKSVVSGVAEKDWTAKGTACRNLGARENCCLMIRVVNIWFSAFVKTQRTLEHRVDSTVHCFKYQLGLRIPKGNSNQQMKNKWHWRPLWLRGGHCAVAGCIRRLGRRPALRRLGAASSCSTVPLLDEATPSGPPLRRLVISSVFSRGCFLSLRMRPLFLITLQSLLNSFIHPAGLNHQIGPWIPHTGISLLSSRWTDTVNTTY